MTSKRIVKEFLNKPNNIVFPMFRIEDDSGNLIEVYERELKEAIVDCLKQAMEDGYKRGQVETEAANLFDVTIGGHKDW